MANPYQPQGDKTDYLMSVLCVIKVLDVLTLPFTAIVGIFWVKKYQLPMMGEGFSTKINAKKILQVLLLAASGAALGLCAIMGENVLSMSAQIENNTMIGLSVMQSNLTLPLQILFIAVSSLVSEFAFRRCLYGEWRKYGILPSIIGSGVITMLLSNLGEWSGMLMLGLFTAMVYEVTRCLVMTTIFHFFFLFSQLMMVAYGQQMDARNLLLFAVAALAVSVVILLIALNLSTNFTETCEKIKVQQQNHVRHPYVFRASFNFFMVILILFQTTPYWSGLILG